MILGTATNKKPQMLNELWELWNWLINSNGLFLSMLLIILIVFVIKPEVPKRISVFFLGLFTAFKWARKEKISRSFENEISKVSTEINQEIGKEILPDNPKIVWAKAQTKEAFIQNGKVVVKLDYHENRNRSFALAAASYVNKGLLPVARNYIPGDLIDSCSLLITRRIITDQRKDALEFFVSEILAEMFNEKPIVREMYEELSDIDNNAMFLQILIPELWKMGEKLYPHNVNSSLIKDETEKLISFLHKIATKESDQQAPLSLDGNLFKLRVIIVGRQDTLYYRGTSPYVKRIHEGIEKGYDSIYLLGYDRKERTLQTLIDKFEDNPKIKDIVKRKGKVFNNKTFTTMNCFSVCLNVIDSEQQSEAS